jgi:ribonuclease VapC
VTVVDTSALFAILLRENDAAIYAGAIQAVERPKMSAATLVEAGAVALRRGGFALLQQLQAILQEADFELVPLSVDQAHSATEAYRRFGRGIGKPACLNFGDCFSYALARALDEPLLFKGGGFARTDVRSAL